MRVFPQRGGRKNVGKTTMSSGRQVQPRKIFLFMTQPLESGIKVKISTPLEIFGSAARDDQRYP